MVSNVSNEKAFPLIGHVFDTDFLSHGLTKRELFAAMAMQSKYAECETDPNKTAQWAVQLAEAIAAAVNFLREHGREAADALEAARANHEGALKASAYWHDLYRKECRLRQDDAARYGQQLEDAESELAALRADAARYRWLREQNTILDNPSAWTITRCDFTDEEGPSRYWVGSDLDAAIDAAMADAAIDAHLPAAPSGATPEARGDGCRICKRADCDDDCEELALIYREQQREKLRDIDPDEIECDRCGYTYGERSHDDCYDFTTPDSAQGGSDE